jgi:hypothetical protein
MANRRIAAPHGVVLHWLLFLGVWGGWLSPVRGAQLFRRRLGVTAARQKDQGVGPWDFSDLRSDV